MVDDNIRASEDSVEYEEFFQAASEGDVQRLEATLLPSLNINALEPDRLQGRAALHIAAQAGSVPAIHFLIAHGAKVDLRNSEGETPLHEAAFFAHPEAIGALLDAGADINLPTGDYNDTALHNVLKYKNSVTPRQIDTIKFLLDRGLDLNAEADSWGSTLIGQACVLNCMELVQILVDRGARLDNTLLSSVDNYAMVNFLLSRGAPIISSRGTPIISAPPRSYSAISNAASAGKTEVVKLLLSHANEVDVDASRDALNWAAASGHMDTVKLLIERGFDVNATMKGCDVGGTPLLATCEIHRLNPQKIAVAKFLVEKGANIHARNQDGKTVAELLVQNDRDGLVREDPDLQQLIARIGGNRDEKDE